MLALALFLALPAATYLRLRYLIIKRAAFQWIEECACMCNNEEFVITVGISLYEGSDDVRWLFLGCRCPKCGLNAVYGDWENEFNGYQSLLAKV
jgi:hypothetical protein